MDGVTEAPTADYKVGEAEAPTADYKVGEAYEVQISGGLARVKIISRCKQGWWALNEATGRVVKVRRAA